MSIPAYTLHLNSNPSPKLKQRPSKHSAQFHPQPSNLTKPPKQQASSIPPINSRPFNTPSPQPTHSTTLFNINGLLTQLGLFSVLALPSRTSAFLFTPNGGRSPGLPIWLELPSVLQSMLDATVVSGCAVAVSSSSSMSKMPYMGPVLMSFERVGCGVAGGCVLGNSGRIELMRGSGSVGDDGSSGCGL